MSRKMVCTDIIKFLGIRLDNYYQKCKNNIKFLNKNFFVVRTVATEIGFKSIKSVYYVLVESLLRYMELHFEEVKIFNTVFV